MCEDKLIKAVTKAVIQLQPKLYRDPSTDMYAVPDQVSKNSIDRFLDVHCRL